MRKAEGGRGDELGEPIGDARGEERSRSDKRPAA